MEKERKMRANDNRKALSKVPVPGMRAIEICHAVEDVKLQEVELNQGPLKKKQQKKKKKRNQRLIFSQTDRDHLKNVWFGGFTFS